ncbi:DMT family transporter [Brevibacterium picturae]|uniref:EamA family transporter n=1 Tax=Brevibacterium picturae TaxID=260553 RepID=A0ABP4LVD3_9MICO
MKQRMLAGFAFMLSSTFLFAVAGPVAKALYSIGWSPGAVVGVRLVGASLLLLIPMLLALRTHWGEVARNWKTIVVYGIISMAGVQAFFFLALEHLSVAVAILLEMMGAPVIIVFWLWARTRQRPSAITGIGVLVSLVGVLFVLDFRNASLSWVGVIFALAAAGCFASFFLVSSNQSIKLPSIAFTGLGMIIGAIAAVVVNLTRIMPADFKFVPLDFAGMHVSWAVPAGLLILFTVGAYAFGIMGLRYLGATVGSFVNLTEVPFSAIAAWFLLGELLTPLQLMGGVVILIGIAAVKLGDVKPQPTLRSRK